MLKLQFQGDQESLWEACGGSMSTLIQTDTGIKQAASDVITKELLDQYRPDNDHWLQHVVALGDYETWGENRNADAYDKVANSTCHPNFVKFGHFFREHRHKDPSLKIGDIKYSAYNPQMKRVELLVWGNKKLAAAEYADALEGKTRTYSMACKIAFDVCNICGHKAKSPAVWCDHMKLARGQYMPEHKKYAFVFNPNPKFFDISDVGYPADRTAYGLRQILGEEGAIKAASAGTAPVISGAEWAELEGVTVPAALSDTTLGPKQAAMAVRLCELKNPISLHLQEIVKAAGCGSMRGGGLPEESMKAMRAVSPGCMFRHMAKRKALLPLQEFAAMLTGAPVKEMETDKTVGDAIEELKGGTIIKTMGTGGVSEDLTKLFSMGGHNASHMGSSYNDAFDKAVDDAEELFNIDTAPERCATIIIKTSMALPITLVERNIVGMTSTKLAQVYGQYVLQALVDMEELHHTLDDNSIAMVAGSIF